MKNEYLIRLVTPLFSYGADPFAKGDRGAPNHDGTPEIRPASIRGHLRWWMRVLGHADYVKPILGSAAGDRGVASKVIVRVSGINMPEPVHAKTMPHKHWSSKTAFRRNTEFSLQFVERFGVLNAEQREILAQTVEAWVLLGGLGQRVTRGSGALAFAVDSPTVEAWRNRVIKLLENSTMKVWVSSHSFQNETEARYVICDTLNEKAFDRKQPLGGIHPRKTSPLRMRPVEFSDEGFRIAVTWIGDPLQNLKEAIRILQASEPKKDIGDVLAAAEPIR